MDIQTDRVNIPDGLLADIIARGGTRAMSPRNHLYLSKKMHPGHIKEVGTCDFTDCEAQPSRLYHSGHRSGARWCLPHLVEVLRRDRLRQQEKVFEALEMLGRQRDRLADYDAELATIKRLLDEGTTT